MKQSKRVSWASGDCLVQVKLFRTEDCPSEIGEGSNDLPPGFEDSFHLNQSKEELYYIPKIEWKCPPKTAIEYNWRVAMGEQSHEFGVQKVREAKLLEAVYPRVTMIPSSPSVSRQIEDEKYDDSLTPIIPMSSIEDNADVPSDFPAQLSTTIDSQSPMSSGSLVLSGCLNSSNSNLPILERPTNEKPVVSPSTDMNDIVTAASSVVNSVMKMKEHGSLIDPDLLVKIFSDRKMIEKLTNIFQTPSNAASAPASVTSSHSSCPNPNFVTAAMPADGKSHHTPIDVRQTSKPDTVQPAMPVSPFNANGSSHHHLPSKLGLPMPMPEPMDASAPRPLKRSARSFTSMKSNCLLDTLSSPLGVTAVQPNSLSQLSVDSKKTINVKDINYIKNLIREHGTDKHETKARSSTFVSATSDSHKLCMENIKPGEPNARFQKPCLYFNGPRGCRNGSNCLYKHSKDMVSVRKVEVPCAKRMKLSVELTGRS